MKTTDTINYSLKANLQFTSIHLSIHQASKQSKRYVSIRSGCGKKFLQNWEHKNYKLNDSKYLSSGRHTTIATLLCIMWLTLG